MDRPPAKKFLTVWNGIYFVVGLVLLYVLLRQVNLTSLAILIMQVRREYLLLAAGVYLCKAGVRAVRLVMLNHPLPPRFLRMLRLGLAAGLAGQLLPLKLGELAYLFLLKKDSRASVSYGLSSLMVVRVMDLMAISMLFIAFFFVARFPVIFSPYIRSILIFMAVLLITACGAIYYSTRKNQSLLARQKFPRVKETPLGKKIFIGLADFVTGIGQLTGAQYAGGLTLALVEWAINYGVFHLLLVGLGFAPTLQATVVSVTFAALASVLPINSFGSFGTQEAGWATGMILVGYSKDVALSSGFATHLLTLGIMLITGGISWISFLVGRESGNSEIVTNL